MSFKGKEALLSFEFASSTGEIKPLTFQKLLKVIAAYTMEDVLPSFQLVQDAVNSGYYAAGFLSYESAAAFDSAYQIRDGSTMPLLWFGIFEEPELKFLKSTGSHNLSKWKPNVSLDEYRTSINSIKEFIENGDTYQINYTIRLHSEFGGDDSSLFEQMKRGQDSNYCAYINTGDHSILSASPELFFHLDGNRITTRPMKGTIKRGKTYEEDEVNANWLYHSEKNRSENLMIVDLLRNDLGMIAETGSVNVPKLFEVERYPTVHQMTSTVTATLTDDTDFVDVFKALFPCGSITGAPKVNTMKFIADLETIPRDVYCGAIGYITPEKEAIFNVPIRTVVIEQETGKATYGVGGGITWDSTSQNEYHEILAKSSVLEENRPEFQLLESFLLNEGDYFLMEEHLHRLKKSAKYFDFQFHLEDIQKTLDDFAEQNGHGLIKVRFLLDKSGEMTIEGQQITQSKAPLKVILADEAVDQNNPFLYHKTTNREVYSPFQKKNASEVLLWNEAGELTEFTTGNVVLEKDGKLWTPPVDCGLLAGTFRERLIKQNKIHEKTLYVSDLKRCTKLWFINSIRKWVDVELV
ncbi:aminodeoxychorismate synthase component I [Virgibacillus sp. NKC19-3]|uniref:aminodeoxychorismate synthase component I n=1 Tax=Virgibacillus saliphilus TaxID=2831674 RepID=UPI001C9B1930|nr:aminodeoxychorismate synthase component I [Virgibacillus sp. NKC19-3]MBY7142437.1 aminodeoxychorismate synthase component I [Virgibacillus sp. NKC19-3]